MIARTIRRQHEERAIARWDQSIEELLVGLAREESPGRRVHISRRRPPDGRDDRRVDGAVARHLVKHETPVVVERILAVEFLLCQAMTAGPTLPELSNTPENAASLRSPVADKSTGT